VRKYISPSRGKGTAERLPEVLRLQAGQMHRHPEQVGRGRRHRSAQFVLREALELVQDSLVEPVEMTDEIGLQIRCRHPVRVGGEMSSGNEIADASRGTRPAAP